MWLYLFTSYIWSDRARELHSFPARLDFSRSSFFLTPLDIIFRLSWTVMCEITRWPVVGRKRSILARSSHKARLISGRKWGIRLSCCLSHPRLMGRLSHKTARLGLPFFSSAIQLWMWKKSNFIYIWNTHEISFPYRCTAYFSIPIAVSRCSRQSLGLDHWLLCNFNNQF